MIINDIKEIMPKIFIDCLNGKYKDENRWISREDFERLKDTDGYVHTCFSFGNKGQTYIYGKDKEPIKKAMHYALMFNDFSLLDNFGIDARAILATNDRKKRYVILKHIMKQNVGRCDLESNERLERLKRFDLQNIEKSNKKQNIKAYNKSYDEVEIKDNSVIYCDIPYKSTGTYNENPFDYDKFYEWALRQTQPIFISEYDMPNDFVCIAEREKTSTMSPTRNDTYSVEKIFIPKTQKYIPMQQSLF